MSANPIDNNSTPKATGSLEELFRHHLGEEAAVPPRPMLWDQIDNSLLIRQNETYRRRLAATRWVAAASLLLATLAGTGWWAHRASDMAGTEVATTAHSSTSAGRSAANGRNYGSTSNTGASISASATSPAATRGSNTTGRSYDDQAMAATSNNRNLHRAASAAVSLNGTLAAQARQTAARGAMPITRVAKNQEFAASTAGSPATYAGRLSTSTRASKPQGAGFTGDSKAPSPALLAAGGTVAPAGAAASAGVSGGEVAASASTPAVAALSPAVSASGPEAVGLLAAHPAAINLSDLAALPNGLTALDMPASIEPAVAAAPRWHYGASYTAGVFNPNINFSRAGIAPEFGYNPALGPDSPAITEAAAAQYRENLRPGLSQRIALLAARHLGGHWSLSTGAEFTQATASSASSPAFVGEQILDLGQSSSGPMRSTDFRYRMAGVPLEVRYANNTKRGWSLYGRLGGVVTALLGVRSEVEGNPEATRTYSFMSGGSPYRRVMGSVRGGAGAQFRPGIGNWALTLGPVAELGLNPLNAHPAQSFLAQSRPYSLGLEAGMEFGR